MTKNVFDFVQIAPNRAIHHPKIQLNSYTHIRGYHCCRPLDPDSYRRGGIRPGTPSDLQNQFRALFKDATPAALDEAIQRSVKCYPEPADGREVYLGLDHRFLLSCCSHYALSGSEKIKDYAANLENITGMDCLGRLKKVGTPSVVIVDVPIDYVEDDSREYIDELLSQLADGKYEDVFMIGDEIDAAISFRKAVPAEWVVDVRPVILDGGPLRISD